MAPKLTLDNQHVYIEGLDRRMMGKLSKATSYLTAGFYHTQAFKMGRWDGRKRLISIYRGRFRAPLGLSEEIAQFLTKRKIVYGIADHRALPTYSLGLKPVTGLRPYQNQALELATMPYGALGLIGRGILKMPPRSGKTRTAAAIIAKLNVRTLFLVPSQYLLYQAQEALSEALGREIGIVGDGEWDTREITVSTLQTLIARKGTPEYLELLDSSDLLIADECHHLEGDEFRKVVLDSPAPYKLGLSATVFLDHKRECELGVIWLRACTGEILLDISVSELIEMGYLVRPEVRLYRVREPDLGDRGWSQSLHKEAIFGNVERNAKIVNITRELVNDGHHVVIVSNRLQQVDELYSKIALGQTPCEIVVGKTSSAKRKKIVKQFREGSVKVLIGTVLSEGVDIPEIDAVVNAEGGTSIKTAYQRLRCLTPCNGKERAIFVDFIDLTHSYFAKHSRERLAVYRSEPAFQLSFNE